jgi:hypothetical protein
MGKRIFAAFVGAGLGSFVGLLATFLGMGNGALIGGAALGAVLPLVALGRPGSDGPTKSH